MKAKEEKLLELEKKPVRRLLFEYSLPAVVGMVAMSLYNAVDSVYVGAWCSAACITAMALIFPLMNLTAAIGTLVGLGGAATASITLGLQEYDKARRVLGHCVLLGAGLSMLCCWLPLFWLDEILIAFGADAETLKPSRDFMLVMALGYPIFCTFLNLNHLMRASGYPHKAMVSLLISMVVNIGVAPIYMKVLGWGMAGAAAATITAQTVGLVWVLIHFRNRQHVLHFCRGDMWKLNGSIVRRILTVGLPPSLLNLVACGVVVYFNMLFMQHIGPAGVGAYGVVNRIMFMFVMVVLGITQGMQPIAGYNLGLGEYGRVRRVLYLAMLVASCVTISGFILVQLFPHACVYLFAMNDTDPNAGLIVDAAERGIRLISIAFPLVGSQIVIGHFFQAIGRPAMSIFLNLTRQLIILVPLLCVLPNLWGADGIWLSQTCADALSAAVGFLALYFFLRHNHLSKSVFSAK